MENYYSSVASIIEDVGKELAENFGKAEVIAQKTNSPGDVVTELDRKTEKIVAGRLKKLYPSIDFVGEEFGGNGNAERLWILDPIDGTAHFIRGIPFCTTQIALIEEGQVIFSIIYNFVTKEMFSAQKGMGAKLNGKPIRVSNRQLKDAYVTVETHRNKKENMDKFRAIGNRCPILTTINTGFEFGLLASGKIEARVAFDPHGYDWDYAPGSLLVSEAGGIVKNIGNDSYDYRNHDFIASNREVYDELKGLL
jgi:myo-inositol-1(or 4)-monophosphatase